MAFRVYPGHPAEPRQARVRLPRRHGALGRFSHPPRRSGGPGGARRDHVPALRIARRARPGRIRAVHPPVAVPRLDRRGLLRAPRVPRRPARRVPDRLDARAPRPARPRGTARAGRGLGGRSVLPARVPGARRPRPAGATHGSLSGRRRVSCPVLRRPPRQSRRSAERVQARRRVPRAGDVSAEALFAGRSQSRPTSRRRWPPPASAERPRVDGLGGRGRRRGARRLCRGAPSAGGLGGRPEPPMFSNPWDRAGRARRPRRG